MSETSPATPVIILNAPQLAENIGAVARVMANFGLSLMPMSQLTIEDTWFMVGMKGTGSNTIVAKDVFVPEHRFLPYPQAFAGTYRTEFTDEAVLTTGSGPA